MATTPSPHRNDPCPCGSGLKYKACHGKLGAGPAASAAPATAPRVGTESSLRNGLDAMGANRLDEALAWFDGVLAQSPANAAAQHYKGYVLCMKGNFDAGLPLVEQGAALDPGNADFQNRVGFLRYIGADPQGAIPALERTIALAPNMAEAHSNLALALRDLGEADRALVEVRRALELKPDLAPARFNYAMVLLALGRFGEAWPAISWRPDPRVNLRDVAAPNSIPHASILPPLSPDPSITLHGEQGLGDTLFCMRFAAALKDRGARLRFWGDARLGPMLVRSGLVTEWHGMPQQPPALDPSRLVWVGDLPHLTQAGDSFPAPAHLVPEEARRERMAERLASAGPGPYVALTWRAGLPRRGKIVLAKEIAPALLGRALAGTRATFINVQRDPQPDEVGALESALGAKIHDFSAANSDLDDVLALMATVDDYVGVSNTNTHLRAGVGKSARVLVPWPAEWRWTRDRARSPWFPAFPLYRARAGGDWSGAMDALRNDLSAA
jgi:tetratricopeptide (TPR) repeat protein